MLIRRIGFDTQSIEGIKVILHIPHSSTNIPEQFREQFLLTEHELQAELLGMTDAYTDILFDHQTATKIIFPYSRLLVDVERFPDDELEIMSQHGMGMIYTKTSASLPLRRTLQVNEKQLLRKYYDNHHQQLLLATSDELKQNGTSLIVDCHSFPEHPYICNIDKTLPRPDFCIGTDQYHTPENYIKTCMDYLVETGFKVKVNSPYSGTMVPLDYYGKNNSVISIMIEVNRNLYMNETTGRINNQFVQIRTHLQNLLTLLINVQTES